MADTELKTLMGFDLSKATPAELGKIQSEMAAALKTIEERQKVITEAAQAEVFKVIAEHAQKVVSEKLGWAKLPRLVLTPVDVTDPADSTKVTGQTYKVEYSTKKVTATGKPGGTGVTRGDTSEGKITIKKIAEVRGGIKAYKLGGKEYPATDNKINKDLITALKQPDGKSESLRCYEISKKGISGSDIITRHHDAEVSLVFTDSTEETVKEAVKKMEAARNTANAPTV